MKQPPPPSLKRSTVWRATARLYIQKEAQAADESWQQTVQGHSGPPSRVQQCQRLNKSSSVSQDDDDDSELTFAPPRKSRLSAPQLQAQLSRLSDRTRLRRLTNKGAWQQAARREDLCHTHVSHKWLNHLDACAGSVLTPHDCITNVRKRLVNRAWTGFGQRRLCGSLLTLNLSMVKPAAPPAPPGDTTRPFTPSLVD